MKKNVIFFVIDSLGNKNINYLDIELMPFFKKLIDSSFYCPNVYSQAPYTEAAVMSMLCGRDTLDDNGYYYKFEDSKTIFDYFYENGYEVINYIQPHVFPSSILRSNTRYFYNVCFDINVLWSYRLYMYKDKVDVLTEKDYLKLNKLLEDNFKNWIRFINEYLNDDESVSLIKNNISRSNDIEDIIKSLEIVKSEYLKFLKNKNNYVKELLITEKKHNLFKIKIINQNIKLDDETKKWVTKKYKDLFNEIYKKNKKMNLKFSKFSVNQLFFEIKKYLNTKDVENIKNVARYIKNYIESFKDDDLYERCNMHYDGFKAAPSITKHFDHFLSIIEKRKNNYSKPYFACIHIDDIHNPEVFFSYDVNDKNILTEELDLCKNVLEQINEKQTGSVSYYLSLAYIDLKLKKIFEELKRKNILDDTTIVITGDHGFSYDNIIIRSSRVNNFYLENYHVPLLIHDKDIAPSINTVKHSSKDILPTLLMLNNIEYDKKITADSLFSKEKKIITMEYVGGGCPDLDYRNIMLAGHDDNYFILSTFNIDDKNDDLKLLEVYNLKNDPDQLKNIFYKKIGDDDFKNVYNALKTRSKELKKNYYEYNEKKY